MDIFQIIFGWPAAIAGITLLIAGVASKRILLTLSGAGIATVPFLYVSLFPPPFRWFGIMSLLGNWLSSVALKKNSRELAALSITPSIVLEIWLGSTVLEQH